MLIENPRVFISYARKDGEAFALQLYEELQERNIRVWMDRFDMYGGVGWWKQIQESLDKVSFLVLVSTDAAMVSPVVEKEWRYARQNGICVFPILPPQQSLDFSIVPRWMKKQHFYSYDKQKDRFFADLELACHELRVPFMAPDLPTKYVKRHEYEEIITSLKESLQDKAPSLLTILKGPGGFGKTTLATGVCHDDEVQTLFDDGILWTSLGREPDILKELTKLYRALTGEWLSFIDADEAAYRFAEKLENLDCLLVIDDIWQLEDIRPFLRGGKHCVRLITTRNLALVDEVKSKLVPIYQMNNQEALSLLLAEIDAQDLSHLERLAEDFGYYPLLLNLANAVIRKRLKMGDSLQGAILWINESMARSGTAAFDYLEIGSHNQAIAQSIETSLELLEASARGNFLQLGILPKGINTPFSIAEKLWQLNAYETNMMLEKLADLSLLQVDLSKKSFRLHDVLRDYANYQLGETRLQVHRRFISNFDETGTIRLEQIHQDLYLSSHLVYHLREGQELKQAQNLFQQIPEWTEQYYNSYKTLSPNLEIFAIRLWQDYLSQAVAGWVSKKLENWLHNKNYNYSQTVVLRIAFVAKRYDLLNQALNLPQAFIVDSALTYIYYLYPQQKAAILGEIIEPLAKRVRVFGIPFRNRFRVLLELCFVLLTYDYRQSTQDHDSVQRTIAALRNAARKILYVDSVWMSGMTKIIRELLLGYVQRQVKQALAETDPQSNTVATIQELERFFLHLQRQDAPIRKLLPYLQIRYGDLSEITEEIIKVYHVSGSGYHADEEPAFFVPVIASMILTIHGIHHPDTIYPILETIINLDEPRWNEPILINILGTWRYIVVHQTEVKADWLDKARQMTRRYYDKKRSDYGVFANTDGTEYVFYPIAYYSQIWHKAHPNQAIDLVEELLERAKFEDDEALFVHLCRAFTDTRTALPQYDANLPLIATLLGSENLIIHTEAAQTIAFIASRQAQLVETYFVQHEVPKDLVDAVHKHLLASAVRGLLIGNLNDSLISVLAFTQEDLSLILKGIYLALEQSNLQSAITSLLRYYLDSLIAE